MLIGIDIGTSGTKTVLFRENGQVVDSYTGEYPLYQPKNGYAEQNPEDWWKATLDGIKYVTREHKDIKGIGLSGQMHGLVMLDKDYNVLRPSIIWCDQRTAKECEEITSLVGAKRLIEITANPALTGFTASKVMWVKNNEPEIYEKCAHILLPKDYIRFKLTGELATEVSDASGMQFLDVPNRCWSDEILSKLQIDKSFLAPVYESCEVTGKTIIPELPGVIVVGGAGDQAACAVGNGIVKEGVVSSTIGTSGVVFAHTDKPIIDQGGRIHTFCHAVPGAWHVMGVTQAAALSLSWFRDNFCPRLSYKEMDDLAEKAESNRLLYLPYLMGERTPHLDPDARGVFFGLSAMHKLPDLIRAVMEGVVFSLNDCMEIIKDTNLKVNEVRASGGGGKSKLWRQMQADVFNINVNTINSAEGGALGVAILAGVGAGIYDSVPKACEEIIKISTTTTPKRDYSEYYALYCEIYPKLKDAYKKLANI